MKNGFCGNNGFKKIGNVMEVMTIMIVWRTLKIMKDKY
jgi:hypothetical protein